jgi:hypothetical protein
MRVSNIDFELLGWSDDGVDKGVEEGRDIVHMDYELRVFHVYWLELVSNLVTDLIEATETRFKGR